MYENVIYNRNMFYRDKFYDYKKFCERITLAKSNCNISPPPKYPFLKTRPKKKEMEREKKKEIEYTRDLLLKKYISMHKKKNQYHPSNLKFMPHPPSLKLSRSTLQYYELYNNNKIMGNKIKEVQKSIGNYNCAKSLKHYKSLKNIGDEMAKNSKYNKNILLKLVSPHTYEKRLIHCLGKLGKKCIRNNLPNDNTFTKTSSRFYSYSTRFTTPPNKYNNNNISKVDINKYFRGDKSNQIDRENVLTN